MATILWAYLRNPAFKTADKDYHVSADLTGQANHLAVTINADIVKQKMAENNGGYNAIKFGKTSPKVYSELTTDHPIDLVRYQVANCYMGRVGHDQFRRRIGQERSATGGAHRGNQQARRRHGADLRAQGVPEADAGRRRAAQCDSGCVCVERSDGGVIYCGGLSMKKNILIAVAVAVVVIFGGLAAYFYWQHSQPKPEPVHVQAPPPPPPQAGGAPGDRGSPGAAPAAGAGRQRQFHARCAWPGWSAINR